MLFKEADGQQGGMSLVHVTNLRMHTDRVQQVDATQPEHRLLAEPVVGVATIQVICKLAVPRVVAFKIGVEQKDGEDMTCYAQHIEAPRTNRDISPLQHDGDGGGNLRKTGLRVPRHIGLRLLPVPIEMLAEVAATVRERHGDHRRTGIRRGTKRVTSQHPEPARVGRKLFA